MEKRQVVSWLEQDAELRARWEEIRKVDDMMRKEITADQPSLRFRKKVLEQISTSSVDTTLVNHRWLPWIVAGFMLLTTSISLWSDQTSFKCQFWPQDRLIPADFSLSTYFHPLFDLQLGTYWVIFTAVFLLLVLDQLLSKNLRQRSQS